MEFHRSSGVLLHVSSLPANGGIGDLGPAAYEFLDFLAAAKQHVWQVLPLGPTGYGDSPYAGISAFAGNASFISLETLAEWGWLEKEPDAVKDGRRTHVNYTEVLAHKTPLLHEAAGNFLDRGPHEGKLAEQWKLYEEFCRNEAGWLTDYAIFAELRRQFKSGAWAHWPEPLLRRDPEALAEVAAVHARSIDEEQVLQFAFAEQWRYLRDAAARKGIRILGDMPIFVNMDSADVWVHPELFDLDENRKPVHVAGVPPDYFSRTGQRWGNPLYRWDRLAESGYEWWVQRMRRACQLYDIVRLDHFRGFEAYWSIPASEKTAVHGEWVKAPGWELFKALERALGPLPLVAEDLGMITPEVDALRHEFNLPGMKVLQFGFGDAGAHVHLPHRYTPDTVAYTGTHDNNTTQGWWQKAVTAERGAVEAYVGPVGERPVWPLVRAVEASVAGMAIFPAQDLLELGASARMNMPSVPSGNWTWCAPQDAWTPELAARLAAIVEVTDRDNDPLGGAEKVE
jgi:4-alpha-glucanotransferase